MNKEKTTEEEKNKRKFLHNFYVTKILRDDESRDYLMLIISKALSIKLNDVKEDFELVDIKLGINEKIKDSEADIVASSQIGYINIEINYAGFKRRDDIKNKSYICELILRQLKPGPNNKYTDLKKVYQINIDGFDIFGKNKFIYTSILMEENLHIPRKNNFLKIIDINLDFLKKMNYTTIKELEPDSLERLLYIFANSQHQELDEVYIGDEIMEKIKQKLYDLEVDNLDQYLLYDREELIKENARDEGLEEGRKENQKEIIITMYKNGISPEKMHNMTEIPIEEINETLKKYSSEKD